MVIWFFGFLTVGSGWWMGGRASSHLSISAQDVPIKMIVFRVFFSGDTYRSLEPGFKKYVPAG
jgi:hypothetical protein